MTVQEAYKRIIESKDLKKEAISALNSGKVEEFLNEQGIDVSLDQLKEYWQSQNDELSKEELDMAAGGIIDHGSDCH